MKFRKKPVEIEAWPIRDLCHAAAHDWPALPKPVRDLYDRGGVVFTAQGMHIPTLEGSMFGGLDDLLVLGTRGEFYPCKPGAFADTFEPVTE